MLELGMNDAILAQNKLLTQIVEELTKQLSKLPQQLKEMHSLAGAPQQIAFCELCTRDHQTGVFPPINEEVNYMGNQQRQAPYQGNPNYPHGNNANYGQGWRQDSGITSKPNLYQNYQHQHNANQPDRTSKLEDTLQQSMQQSMANQKNTDASIKNLETQVGQIAKQLSEQQGGTFTATTQPNPKEHCKAITTRSRKMLNTDGDENERRLVENREEEEKKR